MGPSGNAGLIRLACWLGSLTLCSAVSAQGADSLRVRSLAATCANCHGTEGRAVDGASVPGLAGRSADDLIAQMRAFRSGERPATVMHQIARGYTDAQIAQIAGYFASRPK